MSKQAKTRDFRDEVATLHLEIYRRNQARIHAAVAGTGDELGAYENRYRRSLPPFRRVATFAELLDQFKAADVTYLGDYHTLDQAQRSMIRILRRALPTSRPLVLAVEFVESRRQHVLDAHLAGEMDEETFLRRIEYQRHWPYGDFAGPRSICEFARDHGLSMLAIDLDAAAGASLAARDRHAARRIAHALQHPTHPQVFCLIGEYHLAPSHLPRQVRSAHGQPLRQFTIHQNPERVYRALETAGLEQEAEVVELTGHRYALNVVPPIVCQHSFLRWLDDDDLYHEVALLREAFNDQVLLIAKLLELDIDDALAGVQVETFRDLSFLDRLQRSNTFTRPELRAVRQQVLNSESYYIPRLRLVYLGTPSVNHSSEEAAHFLRHHVVGEPHPRHPIDAFYDRAVNEALAFFCSKLVNNKRKAAHEHHFQQVLQTAAGLPPDQHAAPTPSPFEQEQALRVLEHKRLERGLRSVDTDLIFSGPSRLVDAVAHALGYMLGDNLFYGVVRGKIPKQAVRSVFCAKHDRRGAATTAYFTLARQVAGVHSPKRV